MANMVSSSVPAFEQEQGDLSELKAPNFFQRYLLLAVAALGAGCHQIPKEEQNSEALINPSNGCFELPTQEIDPELIRAIAFEELARVLPILSSIEAEEMTDRILDAMAQRVIKESDFADTFSKIISDWKPTAALMRNEIVRPAVRICPVGAVGSGILFHAEHNDIKGNNIYYVLTCYHVVRDDLIQSGKSPELEVFQGSFPRKFNTNILAQNEFHDLAIVSFETEQNFQLARFASVAEGSALDSFDWVVLASCPNGVEPIPTFGHITKPDVEIAMHTFLQLNVEATYGSSGGGVFDPETRELVGIYGRIQQKVSASIMPSNLGYAVPTRQINDFLTENGFLLQADGTFKYVTSEVPEVMKVPKLEKPVPRVR